MVECPNGKLLVYASSVSFRELRLKSVSLTVARIAKLLGLDFELVTLKGKFKPIYVYYKDGGEEPIPLYCNKGEKVKSDEIRAALKSIMFTLSFHPQYSALVRMREKIMRLS